MELDTAGAATGNSTGRRLQTHHPSASWRWDLHELGGWLFFKETSDVVPGETSIKIIETSSSMIQ